MFQERGTVCGCCLTLVDLKFHQGMQWWALPCLSAAWGCLQLSLIPLPSKTCGVLHSQAAFSTISSQCKE